MKEIAVRAARVTTSPTHRRRMLAVAGLAAGALALGLTACSSDDESTDAAPETSQEETTEESSEEPAGDAATGGEAEDAPAEETEPAEDAEEPAADGTAGAGDTVTFETVELTVAAPEAYEPGEFAIGHTEGNQPYKLTVTVENTGSETYDMTMLLATARAGEDGVEAESIFDDTIEGDFSGPLAAGQTATVDIAFDVPADASVLNLSIENIGTFADPALWTLEL
jgi:plastocyanin